MGFEPTQLALVELESAPLDHSGKLSYLLMEVADSLIQQLARLPVSQMLSQPKSAPRHTTAHATQLTQHKQRISYNIAQVQHRTHHTAQTTQHPAKQGPNMHTQKPATHDAARTPGRPHTQPRSRPSHHQAKPHTHPHTHKSRSIGRASQMWDHRPKNIVRLIPASGSVAQWIRHRPTEPGIARSSPAKVTCEQL